MTIVLTCDNRGPTGSCDTCGARLHEHCPTHPMNPNNVCNEGKPFGKCVITGVLVQVDDGNPYRYAHGDLFDGGSVWIVHRAGWIHERESLDKSRKIVVMPQGVFERSNVMVAAKSECVLSQAALDYMQEMWGSNGN